MKSQKTILRHALALSGLLATLSSAWAEHPNTAPDEEQVEIRIASGDTLIGIATQLLQAPQQWPQLQKRNHIRDPYRLQPGSTLQIPVRMLRSEALQATVESIAGSHSSTRGTLAVGAKLITGDEVRTGRDGYVVVRLPDGSRYAIQPETVLQIEQLQKLSVGAAQRTRLSVPQGRVLNEVEPLRGPGARYEIRTPTGIIGVRGTAFRLAHDAGTATSRVEVVHGAVARQDTLIAAGSGAVMDGQGITTEPLLAPPPLSGMPARFERPLIRFPLPAAAGTAAYRLIISATQDFSTPVFDARTQGKEARVAELPDGDYFFTLRGVSPSGLEGQDASGSFRLKARPEPPFAVQPPPDAKQQGESVRLEWTEQPEASRYKLQLAADADFSQLLEDQASLAQRSFTATLAPGTYFWRMASVRASGDTGPWSDRFSFTLKALQGPPEPPAIGPDSMSFAWPGEPDQRFEFVMAQTPDFANPTVIRETDENRLVLPRPDAGKYYVRIRARDPDGFLGNWSSPQQFEVARETSVWWLLLLLPLGGLL